MGALAGRAAFPSRTPSCWSRPSARAAAACAATSRDHRAREAVSATGRAGRIANAVAKSPSGGDLPGLERHVVAERFELSDEASGEAVGVLAGEVVAAEVAV